MFKNYFTTAFRSIKRNLSYSFLNIFGLTLGVASCLVIILVVRNELNYDGFNSKAGRTYRITLNALDFNSNVSVGVVPAMRNDFPELEQVSQAFYIREGMVKVGDVRYVEKGFAYGDEQLPKVFDYQWVAGNPTTALTQPNSIVLTESAAKKYFGDKHAMGQRINLDNRETDFTVTGLIKDLPPNTSLPFNFLVSLATIKKDLDNMHAFYAIPGGSYAFIVLPKNYPIQKVQARIKGFIAKNWGADIAKEANLPLQPLRDIHFDQRYINNIITPVSKDTYFALAGVALLIIITACINFINLATAQSIKRAKEVGVRKVLGAQRSQLIQQFMGETTVLVLVSVALGVSTAALFLSSAGEWLDIKIDASQLAQPGIIGLIAGMTVVVILLAGLYPSFVQSAFQPVQSLKSKMAGSARGLTLRKSLVVMQFAISQILIIGTLVVAYQMDFFQNQDLGFNKEAVVSFGIPDDAKREVLRQQLANNPGVKEISFSSGAPAYNSNFTSVSSPEQGVTKDDVTEVKFIDEKYTDMFGLKMLAGQKVMKKSPGDSLLTVVVNETLVHKLGIQEPRLAIGKHIILNGGANGTIMGVVQDFQSESKHKKRRACVLIYSPDRFYTASVRLNTSGMKATIDRINKDWSALFPKNLFEYEFLDEHIAAMYAQEQKVYTAFKLFSSIAILIGCLGLYGLVAFAAVQRTKEVGIRKVLGASLVNIVTLFSKEFVLLIGIAFLIAAPCAYFLMHSWLENFAYQININGGIFFVAIAASFVIAGCTIAYQAIKAGVANPVDSLRTE